MTASSGDEKRVYQDDVDQIVIYGEAATEAIEECQILLQRHIDRVEQMESKYLSKQFDDVDDIKRELAQILEHIEDATTTAQNMADLWFEMDDDHNKVGV